MRFTAGLVLLWCVLIVRSCALIPEQTNVLLLSDATFPTALQLYQPLFVLFDSPVSGTRCYSSMRLFALT